MFSAKLFLDIHRGFRQNLEQSKPSDNTQGVNFKQHTYQKHSTTSNQPNTNTGIKDHKGSQLRSYYDNDKNKDDNNDDDDENNNNDNRDNNDIDKSNDNIIKQ